MYWNTGMVSYESHHLFSLQVIEDLRPRDHKVTLDMDENLLKLLLFRILVSYNFVVKEAQEAASKAIISFSTPSYIIQSQNTHVVLNRFVPLTCTVQMASWSVSAWNWAEIRKWREAAFLWCHTNFLSATCLGPGGKWWKSCCTLQARAHCTGRIYEGSVRSRLLNLSNKFGYHPGMINWMCRTSLQT